MPSWWIQTLIGFVLAGVGVFIATTIKRRINTEKGVHIAVLGELERIQGSFGKYGMPSASFSKDSPQAQYFALTAKNYSKWETAGSCLPELFFITAEEKNYAFGFWLNPPTTYEEEYTLSIYQHSQALFVCLASLSHKLHFYDFANMSWIALAGPGDLDFRMVVSVNVSNAKECVGRDFSLHFDAEAETLAIKKAPEVNFAKVNFQSYCSKL